jgi:queuine tRNA-ribosyltransferase
MPVRPGLKNLWLRPVGTLEELFERSFAFAQDDDVFDLLKTDSSTAARLGRLATAHGVVETPAFLPIGTQGSVKAVSPRELHELNAQIILGNTYHLYVRPGLDVIRHFGGLHRFMNWDGPILTDSGGYQIFSLAKLRKLTPEGVHFQNHLDGAPTFISPEIAMEIQAVLGSDIAMVLDECAPYPCDYEYAARSLELTIRWARMCKEAANKENAELRHSSRAGYRAPNTEQRSENVVAAAVLSGGSQGSAAMTAAATMRQLVFGIVQGATFPELRMQSAESLIALEFDGYAIGGVSVGEPENEMIGAVEASVPYLPQDKPRYAMGLGTPPQMLEMISRGIDMFDCVLPTRLARNGTAFASSGTLNLKNAEFTFDREPIEVGCSCPTCREFTRGYIRHLVKAEEILGLRLITLHNLHFYLDLMRQAREAIKGGSFDSFRKGFVANYRTRGAENATE